jgi:hypothetical protein
MGSYRCLGDRAGVTLRHRVHAGDLLISRQPLLDEVHHGIEGPVVPVVRSLCGRVFEQSKIRECLYTKG